MAAVNESWRLHGWSLIISLFAIFNNLSFCKYHRKFYILLFDIVSFLSSLKITEISMNKSHVTMCFGQFGKQRRTIYIFLRCLLIEMEIRDVM